MPQYNKTRAANEPLYEISQIKGTSETFPTLSPNDEFAGFELWDYTLSPPTPSGPPNARAATRAARCSTASTSRGQGKGNPFVFGFIGDSDTHNAAASNEEDNYTGKFAFETDPRHRLEGLPGQPKAQADQIREFSSAGLAGVWAEENTREAIFDAMARRETFGTSGPHLRLVRVFPELGLQRCRSEAARFRQARVREGRADGRRPAAKQARKAPTLLRDGDEGSQERQSRPHPDRERLDRRGGRAARDRSTTSSGAAIASRAPTASCRRSAIPSTSRTPPTRTASARRELSTAWTDPDFKPGERAFYYARVLEIPTPRWSTIDAARLGIAIPAGLAATIQERAWSSSIWYTPG